jgi:hypothetical protein
MKRALSRTLAATGTALLSAALLAPAAFANITGGEGVNGPADDKLVTKWGLGVVFLFPLLLVILSVLQHRKEEREYAHLEAEHSRADLAEWNGGW